MLIQARKLPAQSRSFEGYRPPMPQKKKKPDSEFHPEVRAIWHNAPNLTVCPKFRRKSADKVFAHIKQDKCERCLAVVRHLANEADLVSFLMSGMN
jgi:hypothetical protein